MTPAAREILTSYAIFGAIWYVLQTIAYLGLAKKMSFSKAIAFIPFVREVIVFQRTWKPLSGLVWIILALGGASLFVLGATTEVQLIGWLGFVMVIASIVVWAIRNAKMASCFNRGFAVAVTLFFVNPFGNMVLGYSVSEYRKPE